MTISGHSNVVTCLALSNDGNTMISGSKDTTVMIWNVNTNKNTWLNNNAVPKHILYGHDDEINCIVYDCYLDIIISGANDGVVLVHTASNGQFLRTISESNAKPVLWIGICNNHLYSIIIYSKNQIKKYAINGRLLNKIDINERLLSLILSKDGNYLITGGMRGIVTIYSMKDLTIIYEMDECNSTITSMYLSQDERNLIVGLATGHICIYALNITYLRNQILQQLANLGF